MSQEVFIVLETIVMLFLVILSGLFLRKGKVLDKNSTTRLSKFVVDVAFPALVFTSMLESIDPQILAQSWYFPLAGIAILILSMIVAYILTPLFKIDTYPQRGSAAFSMGTPNWLFIPLPVAAALYGARGETIVLLVNAGALVAFWSVGVWMVRGYKPDLAMLRSIVLNPGLAATVLGIVVALVFPGAEVLLDPDVTDLTVFTGILSVVVQAIEFLGDVTVPLSMVVTGALLGGAGTKNLFGRGIIVISIFRLLLFPAVLIGLFYGASVFGLHFDRAVSMTLIIISAMPIAVTCSVVAEKYEGDEALVSKGIFITTLMSVLTVPLVVLLVQFLGL
ncbi:AEC family transporter [Chitinispirillales bacterium ANBcel5]|uniref:AEC family transporter n=1 Tax=Cellulosispirillum alkaliphilum TaxID=3039283 RepID=UPI002A4EDE20|nr:AEC family transporter [Chitinispirillales bacterium ANBcel5]